MLTLERFPSHEKTSPPSPETIRSLRQDHLNQLVKRDGKKKRANLTLLQGPKPPPFPSTQHSSSSYEPSDGYYGSAYGVSSTSPISPVYSDTPAEQYGSSYGGGYAKRSYEPSTPQEYHPQVSLPQQPSALMKHENLCSLGNSRNDKEKVT
jgi:hypothetical protein